MFKYKKQTTKPSDTDTLIGNQTIFDGKITSEASLRIEGHVTGNIDCVGDVTIGEKSLVESSISAREIVIAGVVHGNIQSKGKLLIKSTGELVGDIKVSSFIVEEGGYFQGNSFMHRKKSNEQMNKKVTPVKTINKVHEKSTASAN